VQRDTVRPMSPRRAATAVSYRYEWALFLDWCTAIDIDPLPATPVTVAEFLGDNPAGDPVQLRRISAINRHHFDAGHPAPGLVTSIRLALDTTRSDRIRRRADTLRVIASALPTVGGTEALFGRRDALLLLLAGAGLSYRAISELERTDVGADGGDVWIGGRHRIRIPARASDTVSPVQVWSRWEAVLQFSDRYPSTALITEHLQRGRFPDMSQWSHRPGPVAVPIDPWGHMPFPVTPMSPDGISSVVHAHLAGAPPRRLPRRMQRRRADQQMDAAPETTVAELVSVELDPGYYERGIAARRRAYAAMSDVPDLTDDVEDRIEQLLQRTLELLDHADDEQA
jgi:hypothetical protein